MMCAAGRGGRGNVEGLIWAVENSNVAAAWRGWWMTMMALVAGVRWKNPQLLG